MADVKISGLPASTTPLAGTEVLPIVQSTTTRQVSVANLTAGRSVSATSFVPSGATIPTNGVYLPAANSVAVATNTAERMRIHSTGGVSIGNTTDPGAFTLSVTGQALALNTLRYYTATKSIPTGATTNTFTITIPGARTFCSVDYVITTDNGAFGDGSVASGTIVIAKGAFDGNPTAVLASKAIAAGQTGFGAITSVQIVSASGNVVTVSVTLAAYSPVHDTTCVANLWSQLRTLTVAAV